MRIFKINEVGNLNTRDNNNFYDCGMQLYFMQNLFQRY